MVNKVPSRHLQIFLIVGALTVGVDYLCYALLLWLDVLQPSAAKAASFVCGTVFAYLANRFWTFGDRQVQARSILLFICLYAATLGVNVGINAVALELMGRDFPGLQIAFLAATACSATLNFLGMKHVVFKEPASNTR